MDSFFNLKSRGYALKSMFSFVIGSVLTSMLHYALRIWKNVGSIIAYVSDGKAANNDEWET